MLGKLIKHEFRATGRKMLPTLGVLALLGLMANLTLRVVDSGVGGKLMGVLTALFFPAFFIGIVVAWIMALVLMITRFYRNLLKDEGYLSFTLPTDAHALIWAKLIVSAVWFLAVSLLSALGVAATVLNVVDMSGNQLREIFGSFSEVMEMLRQLGVTRRSLVLLGVEMIAASILGCLASCLHFYAAMGLGQMSATRKGLFSVLAFIGINIAFRTIYTTVFSGIAGSGSLDVVIDSLESLAQTAPGMVGLMSKGLGWAMLLELVQGGVLYAVTALTLQKKLNLA